jgi:hypothetical protein
MAWQVRSLLAKMRRDGRELCLTWWLADDCADDCLLSAPLPVPRLRQHVSDKWYHTSGSDGGLGLHAHMDAGMNIATGHGLRDTVLAEHDGETFIEYLTDCAYGPAHAASTHARRPLPLRAHACQATWPRASATAARRRRRQLTARMQLARAQTFTARRRSRMASRRWHGTRT